MTDTEKVRLRVLDEKADYALWKIRLEAVCSVKGCDMALTSNSTPAGMTDEKFKEHCRTASGIIVTLSMMLLSASFARLLESRRR